MEINHMGMKKYFKKINHATSIHHVHKFDFEFNKYAEIKEDLSIKLVEYLTETEDPRVEGKDPWKDYIYHQANGFGSTYNRSLPEHDRARAILRPSNHPEHLNKY